MDLYKVQVNNLLKKAISKYLVQDQAVAIRIKCVQYAESAKNYADAVVVSATSITLSIDGVADSTVGSSGVLTFAAYTTLGALVDEINSSANWEAEIVAGLRSDASDDVLLARSTSTFRMHEVIDLYYDSSADLGLHYVLECAPAFSEDDQRANHRVGLKRIYCKNDNDGTALTLKVYQVDKERTGSGTLLAQWAVSDNTEKDTGAQDEPIVHSDYGYDLLVRFESTNFTDTACYLHVQGVRE